MVHAGEMDNQSINHNSYSSLRITVIHDPLKADARNAYAPEIKE